MALTDDELLDFDRARLANWDEKRAQRLLLDEPELFRNHLAIGKWIDRWAKNIEESAPSSEVTEFVKGLREVAAHLRQGDLVPGGAVLRSLGEQSAGRRSVRA